jgi:hypothetical protein
MAVQLEPKVRELLDDKDTVKVLATTDKNGIPHAVVKQTLHVDEGGRLAYLELLESSRTNRNLVSSIWFNRKVSVVLQGKDGLSFEIIGRPVKTLITGPVFQRHYIAVRENLGDVDLAAVWIIEPEEVNNQTFAARKAQEDARHPIFTHLDRLAKPSAATQLRLTEI